MGPMYTIEKKRRLLGILGGLGPLASAYFYEMLTEHTKAARDQDHMDIILSSRATTPDRTDFVLGRSQESPLPYMVEDAVRLEQYGADAIIIPCNTAHYFIDQVRKAVAVPVPSIITETALHIQGCGYRKAAILATEGTVTAGSYQNQLEELGIGWALPDEQGQRIITDIIYGDVKAGRVPAPEKLFAVTEPMFRAGCDCAILGCTELSVMKRAFPEKYQYVDSLECLAWRAIRLFDHEPVGFTEDFDAAEAALCK